jgi:hypothetical protein
MRCYWDIFQKSTEVGNLGLEDTAHPTLVFGWVLGWVVYE